MEPATKKTPLATLSINLAIGGLVRAIASAHASAVLASARMVTPPRS
jgi:hypothetical protein